MDEIGSIACLWRYPVKALAAESMDRAAVEAGGFAGDRRSALFVRSPGHARTGKTYRGKENNRLHLMTAVDDAIALGPAADVALRADAGGPYFDDAPVSLILDAWLEDAAALRGAPVEPLRFRPNILVAANRAAAGIREHELIGRRLIAGAVELQVIKAIQRCVTIAYDVRTGDPDREFHEIIAKRRGNVMGVYCEVIEPGTLAKGDTVRADKAPTA